MNSKLVKLWPDIIGPADRFSLETRIYHTFCLLTILAVLLNIPFKLLIDLPVTALLSAGLGLVLFFTYYLSRYKGRQQLSFMLSTTAVNLLFGVGYFYNGGISGTQVLLIAFSYFSIITVSPSGRYDLCTWVNVGMVMSLLALEYFHPGMVRGSYVSRHDRFLDIATVYLMVVVLIRICVPYIIESYHAAKTDAEQNALGLARLNREKDKLFSIVSHDMHAPLATIQNYLELLVEMDLGTQEKLAIESKLLESTRSTLLMLGNVLSWSKGQLQGSQPGLLPVRVNEVLAEQLLLFGRIAANKNISVETAMDPELTVLGNAGMLQLIARNLVNNAIKFTSPGGRIRVSAQKQGGRC
ncbi:MAG: HAMP domain-containing histidine kinase, partial [Hymenobacter sp.]